MDAEGGQSWIRHNSDIPIPEAALDVKARKSPEDLKVDFSECEDMETDNQSKKKEGENSEGVKANSGTADTGTGTGTGTGAGNRAGEDEREKDDTEDGKAE